MGISMIEQLENRVMELEKKVTSTEATKVITININPDAIDEDPQMIAQQFRRQTESLLVDW